jgi:FAD/FMN-containing dehydrogenase
MISLCERKDNNMDIDRIATLLTEAIGAQKVTQDPAELALFAGGHSTVGMNDKLPGVICRPSDVDDVVKIMAVANEHKVPTTPVSSGTLDYTTHPAGGGLVIDFSWMNKIIKIDEKSDYAVIEPGVTIGQLNKAIRDKGYWAPFGSYPPGVCVLGNYTERGHVAMRTNGPYDDVLGLEIVTPTGIVFRTGSAAFEDYDEWHTVWGPFPDIRGLFMGAGGHFGVFTKGAVRIYPMGEKRKMVLAGFDCIEKSIDYCTKLGKAGLAEQNVIYHWAMYSMFESMYGYSKLPNMSIVALKPWEKPPGIHYNIVTAQMSGYKEDVENRERICARLAEECGGVFIEQEQAEKDIPGAWEHWKHIGIDCWPCEKYGQGFIQFGAFAFVYASPEKIAEMEKPSMQNFDATGLSFGMTYYSQTFDRGRTQSIRFTPFINPLDEKKSHLAMETIDKFYDTALEKYGAVAMLVTHPEQRKLLPMMGGYYDIWKAIKKALDPNNIMNPHILQ